MMAVIRYISKVLVWILTVLVVIGTIGNYQNQHSVRIQNFFYLDTLLHYIMLMQNTTEFW